MNTISNEKYSMSFNQVIIMMITLITSLIFEIPAIKQEYHWIKVFSLLGLYIFLALISNNWREIIESISYISLIAQDKDMDVFEKLSLIKSQLDIYIDLFNNIFTELRNITMVGISDKLKESLKTLWYRAVNGNLTITAGLWIFFYAGYLIFIQTNAINLPFPVSTLVTMGGFMGLSYTSGHMKGVGEFVNELIKETRKDSEDNQKVADDLLRKIRDIIRTICLGYNRVSKSVETLTGLTPMELLYGITQKATQAQAAT